MYNIDLHLEFIQGVIGRLAICSYIVKVACCVVVAGQVVAAAVSGEHLLAVAAGFGIGACWGLDGYLLRAERQYRALYDEMWGDLSAERSGYSLDASGYADIRWAAATFSVTLRQFYGALALLSAASMAILVL